MRILSAKFINLIGVYRASGKNEIFIDFARCRHNITLIVGPNGSGKSTIFNALNPLPDSASMYIEGLPGEKIIQYLDGDDVYTITIKYPVNANGTRAQTKAFITKLNSSDGDLIELNPNGNISSFKSQLYDKFNLDPNFVSLSQLSMDDKGIVDKTPSERKKFVSSILESVEVYNSIYKALSKRSSNFRSIINSITSKIDSIGDEEKILSELHSVETRLDNLNKRKDSLTKSISECEATIRVVDPDGSMRSLYTELSNQYTILDNDEKTILLLMKDDIDTDSLSKQLKDTNDSIIKTENEIDNIKSDISNLLVSREEESRAVQLKQQRLQSLTSDFDYEYLKQEISNLKSNIDNYLNIFKEIGIENFKITKDEYIIGLNALKELKDMVDRMREQEDFNRIQSTISHIKQYEDGVINNTMNDILNQIDTLKYSYEEIEKEIKYNEGLLSKLDILNNRPNKCNINSCSFIVDALEAQSKQPEKEINKLGKELDKCRRELINLNNELENCREELRIENNIRIIMRNINSNATILSKLPNGYIFSDSNIFLDKLYSGSTFDEINDLYQYIRYANIFEQYSIDKDRLTQLEAEYKIHESKNEMIEELNNDIDTLMKKVDDIMDSITTKNSDMESSKNKLEYLYSLRKKLDESFSLSSKLHDIRASKKDIFSKIDVVSKNIASIESSVQSINSLNSELNNINLEITPLENSRDNINYALRKTKEYKDELAIYQTKFQYIETIRKYTSPNKGIQTVFMQMYMGKTLAIANELLKLLFDGRLTLLDYIINDEEFRIPCKSSTSDIINDDIKSCSSAEKSMISMIISFALLRQSSTKYNILKLDEMDGMLDKYNRSQFPIVLDIIMKEMEVENCIMVSHSSEFEMSNVDVIWLSLDNYNNEQEPEGNVIFKY